MKAGINSDIPLETAALFFFAKKHGISYIYIVLSMSWLISFVRANSSCDERGSRITNEKFLLTVFLVPSVYEANALTTALQDLISIEHLNLDGAFSGCAIQIHLYRDDDKIHRQNQTTCMNYLTHQ